MASTTAIPEIILKTRKSASLTPAHDMEPRQVTTTEDMKPTPAKSIKLSPAREALLKDVIDLYSCKPTIENVARYAPNCIYDDQFVYANNRYKMAGQWFALPSLFKSSINESYEVIKNETNLIQFKNEQTWVFPLNAYTVTINALVSIVLDPATADSDFPLILYHKDQANEKDYSHGGIGFIIKKFQADTVMKIMSDERVKLFEADGQYGSDEDVKKHGSGTNAPTINV